MYTPHSHRNILTNEYSCPELFQELEGTKTKAKWDLRQDHLHHHPLCYTTVLQITPSAAESEEVCLPTSHCHNSQTLVKNPPKLSG